MTLEQILYTPEFLANAAIAFASSIIGAFIGAVGGFFVANWQLTKQAKERKKEAKEEFQLKKQTFLEHLYEELRFNQRVLHRSLTFIGRGPNIVNRWSTAKSIISGLQIGAWNEVVKAGVLVGIHEEDRRLFSITNRTVLDARSYVWELEANWHRIREWEQHDIEKEALQPTSVKVYEQSAVPQTEQAIRYAIERIGQALESLEKTYKINGQD
ncbi:hypothetical protein [Brevibacillus centrosporus]|uniref:hypothetical protein n=1 Tax=Brevibacillus centrosporus TaxID=54910 RepID=UPI00382ACC4A